RGRGGGLRGGTIRREAFRRAASQDRAGPRRTDHPARPLARRGRGGLGLGERGGRGGRSASRHGGLACGRLLRREAARPRLRAPRRGRRLLRRAQRPGAAPARRRAPGSSSAIFDGVLVAVRGQRGGRSARAVLYDPRGRGLVARVVGDLDTATHVAVVVPGSDIDLASSARLTRWATDLREAAGEDTAVIAWAGYTTPDGIGVDLATGRLAEAGAKRLTRFTEGLDAAGLPAPALFCHSYGSVVCGLAASRTDARDLVVMGSPGMRADDVAALRTGARVWAAESPHDWITHVPHTEFLGLGHGPDPTSPGFGATVLPATDVPAHDAYFTPGTSTLTAFGAIAGGELR
ncbi:LOW QUALITY PROTEIN: secreted protein, partial [Streptomyces sp. SPB78]